MADEELNVVGALFALNGEDDGYDPEDFVQEIEVDEDTKFRVSVAEDDGSTGALFACAIWNGARFIAKHFTANPGVVEGKTVVEFGAASALPSLAALHFGAVTAVITDYPNDLVLNNIRENVKRNQSMLGDGVAVVRGHLWGTETGELLEYLQGSSAENQELSGFDVAVVAECLWLHHLHVDLLKSIHSCLKVGGQAYVSFAHHVPGHEQNDLSFFEKAKQLFGFEVEYLDTLSAPHLFSPEKMVDQYLYRLTKRPAAPSS